MVRLGLSFLLLQLAPIGAAYAQAPQIILDLNPGSPSSSPSRFVDVNGITLFQASTPATGNELWRTDGTASGTELVKDIRPGPLPSSLNNFRVINGNLFFVADDGVHGHEVWVSDGTEVGTWMIRDINPLLNSSWYPYELTSLNGLVYFRAGEPGTGEELWRTDGTETGTELVKDIYPGDASSEVSQMIALNGELLFWARSDMNGWALWKSDGSEAGTTLVKDIQPGNPPSALRAFHEVDGVAYFSGADTTHGGELWRTDGTETGTWMVKDIRPDSLSSWIGDMRVLGTSVIFSALTEAEGRELWISDGTPEGTHIIADLFPGTEDGVWGSSNPVVVNDWIFFVGNDGTLLPPLGLYKSNGTETYLVSDDIGGIAGLVSGCEGVFFDGQDDTHGWELWYSNGTEAGTYMVQDINPGTSESHPHDMKEIGGLVFLAARTSMLGVEPWICSCAAVGIEERLPDVDLLISPVPTTTLASISLPAVDGGWDLSFMDALGRHVAHIARASNTISVDVTSWGLGVYHVSARNGERHLKGRILVR